MLDADQEEHMLIIDVDNLLDGLFARDRGEYEGMHMCIVPFVSLEEIIPEAVEVALERGESCWNRLPQRYSPPALSCLQKQKPRSESGLRAAGQTIGSCTVISCCWSVNKSHVLDCMSTCMSHVRVGLVYRTSVGHRRLHVGIYKISRRRCVG